MEPYSLRKIPEEEDEVTLTDRIHRLERKMVLMVNTVGTLVTENQCLQEKLDNLCKEPTGIRKTFAETVAAPKVKPVSQETTVPTGGTTVVTNKMDPALASLSHAQSSLPAAALELAPDPELTRVLNKILSSR